ncbi:putative membrane protein YccC [Streptosporangium album]|uniref:Putative membrane protein YccC n=1 Tax=Streptosporangium album TaxID=47479 RepID=A0A7W7WEK1_9ACTN|nr:FUSC family protein [Streptosporangium album]MBB4943948.1 putative membrane protein YccC [Streptosporangium album]
MPPGFRKVADRLTDVAPGWLVEVVRPAPAALRWEPMLRMAVVVTTPLLVGLAAGRIALGILPAMGAMATSMADRGGSYRARTIVMGAAGLAGAVGYAVGALARGHGWWTVLVVVAVSVVSALISAGGAAGSAAGLQLLVMTVLGLGMPLSGPPDINALSFLLGVLTALMLALARWPLHPREAEEAAVIAVYRVLGLLFTEHDRGTVAAFDGTLSNGYTTVLNARSAAMGKDAERTRLVALLNQASLIRNALLSLCQEDREPPRELRFAVDEIVDSLAGGREPSVREHGSDSPALRALYSAVRGATELASGGDVAGEQLPYEPLGRGQRFRAIWERVWYGHLARVYVIRLALCMGVACAVSLAGWFERSYWVMLTVALVLKPDFGLVFARAVQRALGTLVGVLIGTVVLLVVPYGPALLIPIAVFAALLPYGLQRNWGLMSTFQAPLVLFLVDLLTHGGPKLAGIRLVDTVVGCVIVLLLGYLPWPASWEAPVGPRFADAVSATADYLRHAFDPRGSRRALLRRKAYDALADMRTAFQRAVTEPPAISRRITTWLPAMTALEQVTDATAATVARTEHGAPPPSDGGIRALVTSLEDIAADVRAGRSPAKPELAEEESLERMNSAVRGLCDTVSEEHLDTGGRAGAP